ncbi:kinase domain protein [Ancylostoma duodenale]|uniref:Serine/threonine-protein kinase PLK n=1 Tax=Ancylostoma duodenale TaxID=51022 RepID=A0A0C2DCL4_9BILA|nr:kinase domain protein [Ancylostoma duodenale]
MDKIPLKEVPEKIIDKERGITYIRGKFLGKGGFARCYELTNSSTNEVFAGKIVSKTLLIKPYQREKMTQEVQIHRSLSHPHVVQLYSFFEDADNVYITLELCPRRSLMELHKRRRAVTEPEARFFTHQVCLAVDYLHDKKVIHRDLKLGNLFLNGELQVKIGDFGLATTVDIEGERKKTLCGTPNYIAPEVLDKKGHSFEVDIWAIGCILYTLLFGRPPFETKSLKETYSRIKMNQYRVPSTASQTAAHLIQNLLAADPAKRPTVKQVLAHDFFRSGFMPTRLPLSCLTMAPKFNRHSEVGVPAQPDRRVPAGVLSPKQLVKQELMTGHARALNAVPENKAMDGERIDRGVALAKVPEDGYLSELYEQISSLLSARVPERQLRVEDEAPEAMPIFWISKWVDYSDKYGIGYQLCDNSVGVLFNDSSKLVLDEAGNELTYIEKNEKENYYGIDCYPDTLAKKVTLLKYFRTYMNEHLIKAGAHVVKKVICVFNSAGMILNDGDDLARLPVLRYWFRTRSAIVLHLSNGTLQINFFEDHTKTIVCPLMGAITYIDEQRNFRVYKLSHLQTYGCTTVILLFSYISFASKSTLENSIHRALFSTASRLCDPMKSDVLLTWLFYPIGGKSTVHSVNALSLNKEKTARTARIS